MTELNYYSILDIPFLTADKAAIKQGYRRQMKLYHPDNGRVPYDVAVRETVAINQAYDILSDDISKAEYDSSFIPAV